MAKATRSLNVTLRGIVYAEDGTWLAHCLEMDIVAEGSDPQRALNDLLELCDFQLRVAAEEADLESAFKPAPPEYWKLFFTAHKRISKKRLRRTSRTAEPIREFEARELQLT